jgi:hypothetical protein
MKVLLFLILILSISASQAADPKMMRVTTKAVLSYSSVKKTTKHFIDQVQDQTIGDNEEYLTFLVPFVTGEIKYQNKGTNFYYDFRDQAVGARYSTSF